MDVTPNDEKVLPKTKLDKSVEFFFFVCSTSCFKMTVFVKKKERKKTTLHRLGK